jgi:hypothetical protein
MTFGIFIVYKYAEIITHFGDFVNREWGMGLGEGVKVRGEGKHSKLSNSQTGKLTLLANLFWVGGVVKLDSLAVVQFIFGGD